MTKLTPDRARELLDLNDLEIGAVLCGQGASLSRGVDRLLELQLADYVSTLAGATWSGGNPSLEHRAVTLLTDCEYANTTNKARALADLGAEGRALLRQEQDKARLLAEIALAGIATSLARASLASPTAVRPDVGGWEHATEHAVDEVIADLQAKRRRGLSAPGRCLEIYSPWAEVQQTSEGDLVVRLSMLDVRLSEQAVDSLTAALAADVVERASATEAANIVCRDEVDRLRREALELRSREEGQRRRAEEAEARANDEQIVGQHQRGRAEAAEARAERYKREADLLLKYLPPRVVG